MPIFRKIEEKKREEKQCSSSVVINSQKINYSMAPWLPISGFCKSHCGLFFCLTQLTQQHTLLSVGVPPQGLQTTVPQSQTKHSLQFQLSC